VIGSVYFFPLLEGLKDQFVGKEQGHILGFESATAAAGERDIKSSTGESMSKENVALFIKSIEKRSDLKDRIAKADATSESWVSIAYDEGFDFTADELKSVIEGTLGRQLGTANPVREYLTAQDLLGAGELSQDMLEMVAGGADPVFNFYEGHPGGYTWVQITPKG
jgi:hypothetical protein